MMLMLLLLLPGRSCLLTITLLPRLCPPSCCRRLLRGPPGDARPHGASHPPHPHPLLVTTAGAFGLVRLAVHVRTGLRYAVKTVWKRQLRRSVDLQDLQREVRLWLGAERLAGILDA